VVYAIVGPLGESDTHVITIMDWGYTATDSDFDPNLIPKDGMNCRLAPVSLRSARPGVEMSFVIDANGKLQPGTILPGAANPAAINASMLPMAYHIHGFAAQYTDSMCSQFARDQMSGGMALGNATPYYYPAALVASAVNSIQTVTYQKCMDGRYSWLAHWWCGSSGAICGGAALQVVNTVLYDDAYDTSDMRPYWGVPNVYGPVSPTRLKTYWQQDLGRASSVATMQPGYYYTYQVCS
jgi:hypothetical protein